MSDGAKTKRPPRKSLRSFPKHRDARAESLPPPRRPAEPEPRAPSKPPSPRARGPAHDPEAELAHLRNALAAEADQQAEMLVRLAQTERARKAAETRVAELEGSLAEGRAAKRRAEAEAREAAKRAEAAEAWVEEVMGTLEQVQDGLDAGRARIAQLERELARLQGGRAAAPPVQKAGDRGLAKRIEKLRQTRPPSARTSAGDMPVLDVGDDDILED